MNLNGLVLSAAVLFVPAAVHGRRFRSKRYMPNCRSSEGTQDGSTDRSELGMPANQSLPAASRQRQYSAG